MAQISSRGKWLEFGVLFGFRLGLMVVLLCNVVVQVKNRFLQSSARITSFCMFMLVLSLNSCLNKIDE